METPLYKKVKKWIHATPLSFDFHCAKFFCFFNIFLKKFWIQEIQVEFAWKFIKANVFPHTYAVMCNYLVTEILQHSLSNVLLFPCASLQIVASGISVLAKTSFLKLHIYSASNYDYRYSIYFIWSMRSRIFFLYESRYNILIRIL